jgi:hypothetical protein
MDEISEMSLDEAMELGRQMLVQFSETYRDCIYDKGSGLYTSRVIKVERQEGLERTIDQVNIQLGFKRRALTPKRREELSQLRYYGDIVRRVGVMEYPFVRFAIPYHVTERRIVR